MAQPIIPVPQAPTPDSPPARPAVVNGAFIATRAKLIEVAAFLDRAERFGMGGDFRCVALREAAALLTDGKPERARRILEKLSDPTTVPVAKASGQVAVGAWQPPAK